MKNKIAIGICIGLMVLSTGCDFINPPYTVPGPNGCEVSAPTFTPRQNPVRKVLVEDVTGHRCGNCPRAAETIAQLVTTYGDQVVALGLHSSLSGSFTEILSTDTTVNPEQKYTYDFRTVTATDIDNRFGVSTAGLPNGMINRKSFSGSVVVGYTTWSAHVGSELALPQQVDIQLKNFWNSSDNSLCSFYYVDALANLTSTYNICLFVMENDIHQWQKDYMATPVDIQNYTHKHVFRTSLNGSWGTPVTTSTINAGDHFTEGFSISIDPTKWDVNNLYVVAFVYDAATYEVIQAEEVKMIP